MCCRFIINLKLKVMPVKHTPTGIIHKGNKGGITACGTDTKDHADHWISSSSKITCEKNGCKN